MKELAIAESENSTRAATSAAALKRRRANRDFFVLKTTVAAAYRTMQRTELDVSQFGEPHLATRSPDHPSSQRGVVLAQQTNVFGACEQEKSGLQIVPKTYPTVSAFSFRELLSISWLTITAPIASSNSRERSIKSSAPVPACGAAQGEPSALSKCAAWARASTKADLRSENLDLQHFQHGVVALEHPLRLADGQPVVVRAK